MGNYFVDDTNSIQVPSYNILNATIGITSAITLMDDFSLLGFISFNNITNAKYAASAFTNPDLVSGQPVYLEPGLPRNIVASISVKFD